jgi:hypothetical protein
MALEFALWQWQVNQPELVLLCRRIQRRAEARKGRILRFIKQENIHRGVFKRTAKVAS